MALNPPDDTSGKRPHMPTSVWQAPDVGGFVVFDDDRAWAASNAAWRATVPPAAHVLPEASDARRLIEHAVQGGIHYLDLSRVQPSDRALIKGALVEIRNQYLAGALRWGDTPEQERFLRLFDGLLQMFDDPDMGRPLWPPQRRHTSD
jgi:hypothetical protein